MGEAVLLPCCFSSVHFSHSAESNSLQPHELQHARPPCPSPTPGVFPKLMSIESVMPSNHLILCRPLLFCLQSFPSSGSFQMSQFFASGGQITGVSASTSILPMNIQNWFPLGWNGWISLQSKGLLRVSSNTTVQKYQFFGVQLPLYSQLSHPYMTTGKTIALTRQTFFGKVVSLLFNMLSGFSWLFFQGSSVF